MYTEELDQVNAAIKNLRNLEDLIVWARSTHIDKDVNPYLHLFMENLRSIIKGLQRPEIEGEVNYRIMLTVGGHPANMWANFHYVYKHVVGLPEIQLTKVIISNASGSINILPFITDKQEDALKLYIYNHVREVNPGE